MSASAAARRYAKAVLELASESQSVEATAAALDALAQAWTQSRPLRDAFENPGLTPEIRRSLIRELTSRISASHLVKNTLLLLADRGRMSALAEIAKAYHELAEAREHQVRAEVITATALPEAYFTELQKTLEIVTGKKIVLTRRQDSSLIGGVVARVGDTIFDGSVRNQLLELRDELVNQT